MGHEIEDVERAFLESLSAAAIGSLGAELGMRSQVVGSAFASVFGALPATAVVANRAIGLGLSGVETRDTVDRIVRVLSVSVRASVRRRLLRWAIRLPDRIVRGGYRSFRPVG